MVLCTGWPSMSHPSSEPKHKHDLTPRHTEKDDSVPNAGFVLILDHTLSVAVCATLLALCVLLLLVSVNTLIVWEH